MESWEAMDMAKIKQKISTFLWYDTQAEEAARFYTSVFDGGRISSISRHTDASPGKEGSVMLVTFELAGQQFHALNGGPQHPFNESMSLFIECETQAEIDHYWSKLTEGGKEGPCGWLTDKFGVSWQVAPRRMMELLAGDDRQAAADAMRAMYKMKKFVIAELP
jgi:predicted 3-demethylubiquinone-9 3-methyltransferase (glyoxalase superfamily)